MAEAVRTGTVDFSTTILKFGLLLPLLLPDAALLLPLLLLLDAALIRRAAISQ